MKDDHYPLISLLLEGDKFMKKAQFTKGLTIALPDEIYLKIKTITDEKKISMAAWMRVAAEKALNENDYCRCLEGGKENG